MTNLYLHVVSVNFITPGFFFKLVICFIVAISTYSLCFRPLLHVCPFLLRFTHSPIYLNTMKILMAYRQWKRPRNIRRRLFRCCRQNKKIVSSPLTVSGQSDTPVRSSIEKLVYVPDIVEVKSTLPPTYDECVEYAPPLHPPPISTPPIAIEKERGRPRELLYKLQLNDMMLRRPGRPSPIARKPIKSAQLDTTNYKELLWNQAQAAEWAQGFGMVKLVTFAWLAVTCVMLALA